MITNADPAAVTDIGRRVLQTEADALAAMADALPEDFEAVARFWL
ncbi:hypothetical protein Q4577_08215 [Marinovum sp. 2_MG-2023]|nr:MULTISPECIES: hypothetical protein [unclassified Marinovum]MDO6730001.1 hypothetical protein [Marinovum sp. 2_MG-2023]MDO6779815.1 hypothetical protein [Marinovum sp. 1_MG-2023]